MINRYASLKQGLVGCWCPSVSGSFGFRLPDVSQYGNHGTLTNMDPGTDWVPSGGKLALDFDGSNDYVLASTQLLENTIFISAWILGKTGSANSGYIISLPIASGGTNGIDLRNPSNLTVDIAQSSTSLRTLITGVDSRGLWTHVVFGGSMSTNLVYINGLLNSSNSIGNGISPITSREINFGRFGSFGSHSECQIDDVRIYNRVLTPSEIRLLYTGGRGVGLLPERIKHRRKTSGTNRRRRLICGANC